MKCWRCIELKNKIGCCFCICLSIDIAKDWNSKLEVVGSWIEMGNTSNHLMFCCWIWLLLLCAYSKIFNKMVKRKTNARNDKKTCYEMFSFCLIQSWKNSYSVRSPLRVVAISGMSSSLRAIFDSGSLKLRNVFLSKPVFKTLEHITDRNKKLIKTYCHHTQI